MTRPVFVYPSAAGLLLRASTFAVFCTLMPLHPYAMRKIKNKQEQRSRFAGRGSGSRRAPTADHHGGHQSGQEKPSPPRPAGRASPSAVAAAEGDHLHLPQNQDPPMLSQVLEHTAAVERAEQFCLRILDTETASEKNLRQHEHEEVRQQSEEVRQQDEEVKAALYRAAFGVLYTEAVTQQPEATLKSRTQQHPLVPEVLQLDALDALEHFNHKRMPHVRLARDECAGALVKAYNGGEGVEVVPFTAPIVYNFLYPVSQQHKNGKMKDYYRLTVALAASVGAQGGNETTLVNSEVVLEEKLTEVAMNDWFVSSVSSDEGSSLDVRPEFASWVAATRRPFSASEEEAQKLTEVLGVRKTFVLQDEDYINKEAQEKAEARLAARVKNWVAEHALKTGEKNDRGDEAVLAVGALPPSAVRATATSSSSTLNLGEVGYNRQIEALPPTIGIALGSQFRWSSAVKSKSVRHGTRVDTALSFPFDDVAAVCLRFADTNFGTTGLGDQHDAAVTAPNKKTTADRLGQMQAWAWEFGRRYILQTSGAGRVLLWRDMPNRDRVFALLLAAAFAAESRALAEGRSHDVQSPSASSLAAAVARLAGGSLQMQQEGGGLMLLKKSLFVAFQLAGSTTTSGAEVQTGAGEQGDVEEDRLGAVVGRLQRLFFAADSVPNRICRDKMEQGKATSGNGKATYFLTERDLRAGTTTTTPKESLRKMVAIQYLTAAFRRKYALTRMRVLEVDGQGQDGAETTIVWELVPPAAISLAGGLGQAPPPQGHQLQQARGASPSAALLAARLYMTRATFHLLHLLLLNDVVPNALANAISSAAQGIDVRALLSDVSAHLTSDRSGDVESHGKNAIFTLELRAAESVTRSRGLDFEDYLAGHNTREEVDHEFVDDEVVGDQDETSTSRPLSSTLLDASVAAHPAVRYALQAYFSSLRLWSTSGPPVLRRCNVRVDMFGSAVSGFGTEKSDFDFSFTPELPKSGKHVNACYLNVISEFYRNARNPAFSGSTGNAREKVPVRFSVSSVEGASSSSPPSVLDTSSEWSAPLLGVFQAAGANIRIAPPPGLESDGPRLLIDQPPRAIAPPPGLEAQAVGHQERASPLPLPTPLQPRPVAWGNPGAGMSRANLPSGVLKYMASPNASIVGGQRNKKAGSGASATPAAAAAAAQSGPAACPYDSILPVTAEEISEMPTSPTTAAPASQGSPSPKFDLFEYKFWLVENLAREMVQGNGGVILRAKTERAGGGPSNRVLMKWHSIEIEYAPQNEFVLGEGIVLVRRELLDLVERDVGLVVSGNDEDEDSTWVSFKVDLTVNNFDANQAQKLHDIQHLAASDATVRNVGRVFFLAAKQRGLVGTSWKAGYSVMPSFRFLLVYVQFLVDAGLYKEEQELPEVGGVGVERMERTPAAGASLGRRQDHAAPSNYASAMSGEGRDHALPASSSLVGQRSTLAHLMGRAPPGLEMVEAVAEGAPDSTQPLQVFRLQKIPSGRVLSEATLLLQFLQYFSHIITHPLASGELSLTESQKNSLVQVALTKPIGWTPSGAKYHAINPWSVSTSRPNSGSASGATTPAGSTTPIEPMIPSLPTGATTPPQSRAGSTTPPTNGGGGSTPSNSTQTQTQITVYAQESALWTRDPWLHASDRGNYKSIDPMKRLKPELTRWQFQLLQKFPKLQQKGVQHQQTETTPREIEMEAGDSRHPPSPRITRATLGNISNTVPQHLEKLNRTPEFGQQSLAEELGISERNRPGAVGREVVGGSNLAGALAGAAPGPPRAGDQNQQPRLGKISLAAALPRPQPHSTGTESSSSSTGPPSSTGTGAAPSSTRAGATLPRFGLPAPKPKPLALAAVMEATEDSVIPPKAPPLWAVRNQAQGGRGSGGPSTTGAGSASLTAHSGWGHDPSLTAPTGGAVYYAQPSPSSDVPYYNSSSPPSYDMLPTSSSAASEDEHFNAKLQAAHSVAAAAASDRSNAMFAAAHAQLQAAHSAAAAAASDHSNAMFAAAHVQLQARHDAAHVQLQAQHDAAHAQLQAAHSAAAAAAIAAASSMGPQHSAHQGWGSPPGVPYSGGGEDAGQNYGNYHYEYSSTPVEVDGSAYYDGTSATPVNLSPWVPSPHSLGMNVGNAGAATPTPPTQHQEPRPSSSYQGSVFPNALSADAREFVPMAQQL